MLASGGIFHHKKYENPIGKDTRQPDKVLFDKAVVDIEHGRFEVARITLNTLINTYDQSEYLAKAKLAIADSWFREGGVHGMAEAEAEYKDFELFYPTMPEAAEAQNRVCMIHFKQMDKADRDAAQALRAEDECRALMVQYPNSKYVPEAQQRLREIQEALAEGEMKVGTFYHTKGSNPAAANRFRVWWTSIRFTAARMRPCGNWAIRMDGWATVSASRPATRTRAFVRDYPLSAYHGRGQEEADRTLEMPIPQADPAAYARMKYEMAHRTKLSLMGRGMDLIRRGPDVHNAAKSGAPAMTSLRPTVPVSVPSVAEQNPGFHGDVSAQTISPTQSSDLDTKPDARKNRSAGGTRPTSAIVPDASADSGERLAASFPPNHTMSEKERKRLTKKYKDQQKKKAKEQAKKAVQPATTPASHAGAHGRHHTAAVRVIESVMSRILLADDSPHAQRMGERILREEGFEVVSITEGETALLRLADVDPDLIIADVFLPGKIGL